MTKQIVHFKHNWLDEQSYIFEQPIDFVVANHLNEVKPALKQIERYSKEGYYGVGYLSYEAAQAFNPKMKTHQDVRLPYLYFGIYKDTKHLYEVPTSQFQQMNWQSDTRAENYFKSIKSIHDAIKQGLSYQVNYTFRLIAIFERINTRQLYEQLRQNQMANYTCHLQFNDFEIISVSPELFFAWDGEHIETKPMKGTSKRGYTDEEDQLNKEQLMHSKKDQAENVMIVDLLRNDLSRIAQKGSVKVPKLFEIESYPTVFQMTSTVTARTRKDVGLASIFEAIFPCGSITGAPKISTMEIISQIETSPREVYCGAIGMVTPDQKAVFNVPIRTVLVDHRDKKAIYGVGGGITWDSTPENEYEETVAKSNVLKQQGTEFELLETMKLEYGQIKYLKEHMERLERSANFFKMPFSMNNIEQAIEIILSKHPNQEHVIRLLLDRDGKVKYEIRPYEQPPSNIKVALADRPIDTSNIFYYHKTTYRHIYHSFQRDDVYDVLLWNDEGYVTEFTTGNLVYKIGESYFTPPVSDGLLAGTFRKKLLQENRCSERSLAKDDLEKVDQLWLVNSVKGWVQVEQLI